MSDGTTYQTADGYRCTDRSENDSRCRTIPQHSTNEQSSTNHCYLPIISAAAFPTATLPTVTVPDRRYQPLCANGAQRAMNHHGTVECHERGILGEYSFGKLVGVPDQVDTEIYEYGDPGYDFDLPVGTIDVKTARPQWDQPSLLVDASKALTADYFVLVHQLSQRCYRVIGYAPAAAVIRAPVRRISLHSANKVRMVDQQYLWPFTPSVVDAFRAQQ